MQNQINFEDNDPRILNLMNIIKQMAYGFRHRDTSELLSIGYTVLANKINESDKCIIFTAKVRMQDHLRQLAFNVPTNSTSFLKKLGIPLPRTTQLDPTIKCNCGSPYDLKLKEIIELLEPLTTNERNYVLLKAAGYSNIEIAEKLEVSRNYTYQIQNQLKKKFSMRRKML